MDVDARRRVELHEDFADLRVVPGELRVTGRHEQFSLVNLLAFGGVPDRPPHVPAVVGELGDVTLWESTGASDALPFWNTNYGSDVYLFLVHGEVRIAFKEPESDTGYGDCLARTGDLVKLPKAIAHRTYSTSGKRRISLELLARNPLWARLGERADVEPAVLPEIGGFRFDVTDEVTTIETPSDSVATPTHFLRRGLAALVAYELHLDHNEFEGGFVVHDQADHVMLKTPGYSETLPPAAVLAVFKRLLVM